jgi:hypothetical protein
VYATWTAHHFLKTDVERILSLNSEDDARLQDDQQKLLVVAVQTPLCTDVLMNMSTISVRSVPCLKDC